MNKNSVQFYPNPVIDETSLANAINEPDRLRARIIDNTGRVIVQMQWDVSAGCVSLPVDVNRLPNGLCYLDLKGKHINY